MSKEEIVKAIQQCAAKLGRTPNLRDLRLTGGVSEPILYTRFGGLAKALIAAGLEVNGPGFNQPESTLLLDWAGVARKLKKIPSVHEYGSEGRFSISPFQNRYRRWAAVADAFRRFALETKIETAWQDVLALGDAQTIKARKAARAGVQKRVRKGPVFNDRTFYGRPLPLPELVHEPVNELGVVFVFGMLARKLGFVVLHLQPAFPDCEALRETIRGHWQRVRIEFEFESRNFLRHRHKKNGCDMIICWRHNWRDCPANIEVLELNKVLHKVLNDGVHNGLHEELDNTVAEIPRQSTNR
jgi:hypothetical protein